MKERKLRVHHLLCIPLFVGEGYNGKFCENMTQVINALNAAEDEPVLAVCRADHICAGCPNLTDEGECRNVSPQGRTVNEKDLRLARQLGIVPEQVYTYRRLKEIARSQLTREIFEDSCSRCKWYAQGLCSYELWREEVGYDTEL